MGPSQAFPSRESIFTSPETGGPAIPFGRTFRRKRPISQTGTPRFGSWYAALPERRPRARIGLMGCPMTNGVPCGTHLKRPAGESSEIVWELIRLTWSSTATLAMVSFHDLLNVERDPASKVDGNDGHRRWRCTEDMMSASAFYWLRKLTRESTRSAERQEKPRPATPRSSRTQTKIEAAL